MTDKNPTTELTDNDQPLDEEAKARRDFLKKVGVTAATAPAVGMLLASTSAKAIPQGGGCGCGGGS